VSEFTLPEVLIKTVDHFVPGFWAALAQVPDHRNPLRIVYSIQEELLVGILLFALRIGSRRNTKYKLGTPAFIQNLQVLGHRLYPDTIFPDTLLHGDTLNYLLRGTDPLALHGLRRLVIHSLIRKRVLEPYRLRGMYYPVAIDGTWQLTFVTRHCEHCLTQVHEERTIYYHSLLEAKLALDNGLALSVGTAFIENERPDVSKQDCELKAFFRLAEQLKTDFPQLRICLLLDGLYAAQSVFDLCERYHWAYLITFKEGSMPAVFAEFEALKKLAPAQTRVIRRQDHKQTFRWVNDIAYENHALHALECIEETPEGTKRFVWLSSWPLNAANVEELANQGARRRWTIENQGFNVQKNGGYHLEHAYSKDNTAMKNFYLLMQIAHLFNQLMEKGSLLGDRLQVSIGSLKVLSEKLWAAFTETRLNQAALIALLARPIQIRFNTS
jgi:hypothetical protein